MKETVKIFERLESRTKCSYAEFTAALDLRAAKYGKVRLSTVWHNRTSICVMNTMDVLFQFSINGLGVSCCVSSCLSLKCTAVLCCTAPHYSVLLYVEFFFTTLYCTVWQRKILQRVSPMSSHIHNAHNFQYSSPHTQEICHSCPLTTFLSYQHFSFYQRPPWHRMVLQINLHQGHIIWHLWMSDTTENTRESDSFLVFLYSHFRLDSF